VWSFEQGAKLVPQTVQKNWWKTFYKTKRHHLPEDLVTAVRNLNQNKMLNVKVKQLKRNIFSP
jgi:hypothetical protein